MTYEIVSNRKTLDAVAETLAVLGRPHRVSAELGRAAEAPSGDGAAADGFDELLSFAADNPDIAGIR